MGPYSSSSSSLLYTTLRKVTLTQTSKKTKEQKVSIIEDVRKSIDMYHSLYLFSYENMRSAKFKNIRMDLCRGGGSEDHPPSSRIFLGKNKLLQIALGRTPQEEYADNLRHISSNLTGSVGLLFTNKSQPEIVEYFQNVKEQDFARAGSVAIDTVRITKEMLETHPVSMVEQLRKLGLPVEVKDGKLAFYGGKEEHLLCKEGSTLTAETCKLLLHFGIKLAEFRVTLVSVWSDGQLENLEDSNLAI